MSLSHNVIYSIVGWVVIGGIAGWVAGRVTGTHVREGCLFDILTGVVGAFVGGTLLSAIGGVGVTGLNIWSLMVATLGAVLSLSVLKMLR